MQYIKEPLRKRLLEIALDEFDQKGYDGASMRTIAEGAGTSLGNIYRYFRNKDDLYANCLRPIIDQCIAWMEEGFDVSETQITFMAEHMAEYVSEHKREFRIIVRGPAKHYDAFQERFANSVAGKLRFHAETTGCIASCSPRFFDAVALAFISSLREIMEHYYSQEETAALVLELMRFMFADFEARVNGLRGGKA